MNFKRLYHIPVVLVIFSLHLETSAQSPVQIDIGVVAIPTNSWILNSDFPNRLDMTQKFTMSMDYGLALGVNLSEKLGLEINALFGNYNQNFESDMGLESTMKVSKTDIPVLLKLGNPMYLEVGFQTSFINGVERMVEDFSVQNLDLHYKSIYNYVVLGTGMKIEVMENIDLSGGLRLGYGIEDFNSEFPEIIYDDNGIELGVLSPTARAFVGLKIMAVYKL